MNAPNTFATYDMNAMFNFSITFANGYALSTLLPNPAYAGRQTTLMPVSQLEENKIEIAILCNDELIQLNDADNVAFVDPTQLAQVIAILSGLPLEASLDFTLGTSGEFDMVTEAGFKAIRSILSPTTPVNFQASLHTVSFKTYKKA